MNYTSFLLAIYGFVSPAKLTLSSQLKNMKLFGWRLSVRDWETADQTRKDKRGSLKLTREQRDSLHERKRSRQKTIIYIWFPGRDWAENRVMLQQNSSGEDIFGVLTGISGMSNRPGLVPQDTQKTAQAIQQEIRNCVPLRRTQKATWNSLGFCKPEMSSSENWDYFSPSYNITGDKQRREIKTIVSCPVQCHFLPL